MYKNLENPRKGKLMAIITIFMPNTRAQAESQLQSQQQEERGICFYINVNKTEYLL